MRSRLEALPYACVHQYPAQQEAYRAEACEPCVCLIQLVISAEHVVSSVTADV
jgi:hypothetical protein